MDISDIQAVLHREDEVLARVRARVSQSVAVPDAGVGALLAQLADQHGVRHAVVLGGAGAVSCAWLLDGMVERAIITCIEAEGRQHALLADAADELGINDHVRMINAAPHEAAPRLSDGNYDLALLQVATPDVDLLDIAARLLKVGGVLVVRHATAASDDLLAALSDAPWSLPVALDTDDGVVIALRDHDDEA